MSVPVTLLCGYLGAGKTTLINHVLSAAHGVQMAVLVNDFGAINIDMNLIVEKGEGTIALSNGCVCCTIQDDLGSAIHTLLRRERTPQHILIEASGVAEPSRILRYVESWPDLRLDAVVTMADAETVRERARDKFVGGLVGRQLEAADLLVLNKIDLVDHAALSEVLRWLDAAVPRVRIVQSTWGRVDPVILFESVSTGIHPGASAATADHIAPFVAITIPIHAPIDLGALQAVLARAPRSVHRVKGFVVDEATGQTTLVQCVGVRQHMTAWAGRGGAPPPPVVVCIGTDRNDMNELRGLIAGLARPKIGRSLEFKLPGSNRAKGVPEDGSHQQGAG